MPTIISAPVDLVIATASGIQVRFAGLDLNAGLPSSSFARENAAGMKMHLQSTSNDETRRLDMDYQHQLERWAKALRQSSEAGNRPPPVKPCDTVLEPVKARITDDAGTAYALVAGEIGGTGSDWKASWTYFPVPPDNARQLTLAFTIAGALTGKTCVVRLDANCH